MNTVQIVWQFLRQSFGQRDTTTLRIALFCILLLPICSNAELGGDFTLTDHNGQPYHLQQDQGKIILLSFGYTSCPDVCPLTLAVVTATLRQLGERAAQVRPLFISVDPQRDTPPLLKSYVEHFHPSIIGLTGES
ncbi:MAG: SCO family protein [Gammaproteobacteria bacterium]